MDWVPPESFDEYRLIKALGRGSMGQVWLAHDTVLDRLVAVKFIAKFPARDTVRRRFLTEARAAARVQHPNIIAVYRVGEIGPRPYLISEYVRGNSLDTIARPVAWPSLLEIAIGLARGLAAAHRQGVLHRDLKPANAILSETGDVKLLDFGLAKLLPHIAPSNAEALSIRAVAATALSVAGDPTLAPSARDDPSTPPERNAGRFEVVLAPHAKEAGALPEDTPPASSHVEGSPSAHATIDRSPSATGPDAVLGTPMYMSPEVWRGEPATARSDVYSLGVMLYELGAGASPHRRDSPEALRSSTIDADALPMAAVVPGIDPGFAAVVDRCLRRDPSERFASGDAVRAALEAIAAGDKTATRVLARPVRHRPRRGRRRRWMMAIVGVASALAFATFTYHRLAGERSPGGCHDDMVRVPAGTFRMGSQGGDGDEDEHPQHPVTLSAYCIDRTEVTVAAYARCVTAGACRAAPLTVHSSNYSREESKHYSQSCNREDRPDHPINCIDWMQADAYCRWNAKRLPTEAEWEYAARGSDERTYPWGNEPPSAQRLNACGRECAAIDKRNMNAAWQMTYDDDDGWPTTAPVGRYPEGRSPFGALDMAGNVGEWTADWYGRYSTARQSHPKGPTAGTGRVSRGGGWLGTARAADREWPDPTVRTTDRGFRCARD